MGKRTLFRKESSSKEVTKNKKEFKKINEVLEKHLFTYTNSR